MTLRTANASERRLWRFIVGILVGLGILFRVANLSQPVYWVDEVATSMRVSGYTQREVTEQVTTGQPVTASDLLKFQTIRGDRPITDLRRVLTQSPEHAPLYFVLARFWAEIFGSSVTAMRSLPVLFSLLGLPAMYGLGLALFNNHALNHPIWTAKMAILQEGSGKQHTVLNNALIGQTAMGLLAISPFFVAYSQEARPYSLWILLLLLMGQGLVRSLQTNRWQWWASYTLALALTLYTSLLTVLVVCGHSLAVLAFHRKRTRPYLVATGTALIALLPWCWVVITQWQTLQSNTSWMQTPASIWAILGTWGYSLAVLFFDVPVATHPLLFGLEVIAATATVLTLGYATFTLIRKTPRAVWGIVLAGALSIPLVLLLIDLLRNGQAAATPRYLMPTHLGVLIALAFLLCSRLFPASRKWRIITSLLLLVSLLSCLMGLNQPSPYLKSRNLSNPDLTALLNQASVRQASMRGAAASQVITTPHYIQDSISLSYELDPETTFYILPSEDSSPKELLTRLLSNDRPTFLFAPSEATKAVVIDHQLGTLQSVYQPPALISGGFPLTLWQVEQRVTP